MGWFENEMAWIDEHPDFPRIYLESRERERKNKESIVCSYCASKNRKSDLVCTQCGAPLGDRDDY